MSSSTHGLFLFKNEILNKTKELAIKNCTSLLQSQFAKLIVEIINFKQENNIFMIENFYSAGIQVI